MLQHGYVEYYAPDYRLHLDPAVMENMNDREYLEKCKTTILSNLSSLTGAPSVQFQHIPPDWTTHDHDEDTRREDPDVRRAEGECLPCVLVYHACVHCDCRVCVLRAEIGQSSLWLLHT